jgi:histidinol-phosphate aminotransferase
MYPEYARNTATAWVTGRRDQDFGIDRTHALEQVDKHRPSVVLLASPNNPTGTALPLELVTALHDAVDGVVIVDEAYAEFRRTGTPSALTLLARHPRLVVVRTMSKAFAFAGARLGYLAAAPDIISAIQVVRLPYHLSALTQAVARVALAHAHELLAKVEAIRNDRDELTQWLRDQGLTVPDSDANFVLVGRFKDRHAVWQALLDRGVLVRETGPEGFLRVTVGTPVEMTAFRAAAVEVMR